jgi:hypothetical protein
MLYKKSRARDRSMGATTTPAPEQREKLLGLVSVRLIPDSPRQVALCHPVIRSRSPARHPSAMRRCPRRRGRVVRDAG